MTHYSKYCTVKQVKEAIKRHNLCFESFIKDMGYFETYKVTTLALPRLMDAGH